MWTWKKGSTDFQLLLLLLRQLQESAFARESQDTKDRECKDAIGKGEGLQQER